MTERVSLAAGYLPDPLVLALLGVCAAFVIYEAWTALRRPRVSSPWSIRWAVFGLRLLAVGALAALVFELTLRVESVLPAGRRLVMLVDSSASMGLPDATEPDAAEERRSDRVQQAWRAATGARAAWAEQGLVLDVRSFDRRTEPIPLSDEQSLPIEFDGVDSDLARALAGLGSSEGEGNQVPIAGVLAVSDGLVAEDRGSERHLQDVVDDLGVPLTTVATGAPFIRDVAVAEVQAEMFAFVENVTEFEATLVAHGLENSSAEVELKRNGEVVARRRVLLRADGMEVPIRFEVAPDRIGQFVYEVAVSPLQGEATVENNSHAFVVKVLRDKVRVLHVAGRPDWDVRSLRTLLRRDPNVELLSYYILRGMDDIARDDTAAEELSLIPFPTDELFEQELGSFDLVILHNFDAMRHQVGRYLGNIAEYVLEGGALVLIGGDLGLAEGGYASPDIAALLPVQTRAPAPLQKRPFRPKLTDAGRRHPITAWLASSTTGWKQLPELDGFNATHLSQRDRGIGGAPLLVHPDAVDETGRPRPILAVAEPGRGRAMVLATGSSWRLGFAPDLPLVDGARPYDLLWLGAIRWLLRDETSGRLSLETDKPRYQDTEPIELRATTLTPSYAPEAEVQVSWEVHPLRAAQADAEPVVQGTWQTDSLGRAKTELDPLAVGAYEAIARRAATQDEGSAHEARRVFLVEPPGRELAHVDADPGTDRLRNLAEQTGGEHLVLADGDELPTDVPLRDPFAQEGDEAVRVAARHDRPLWNGWLALALLLISFGGEWILRRRHGEA